MARKWKRRSRRRRKRLTGRALALPLIGLLILALGTAAFALTNTILNIDPPRLGANQSAINANALKPSACSGISVDSVTEGNGGGGNELILGSAGGDQIRGNGGNDCVLGGAGDDYVAGDGGTDVCIGGPGNDTFGVRVCIWIFCWTQPGNCETEIQ